MWKTSVSTWVSWVSPCVSNYFLYMGVNCPSWDRVMGHGRPCEWNFGGCEVGSFRGTRYRGRREGLCYQPLPVCCHKTNTNDLFIWQKQMSESLCLKILLRPTGTGHGVFCGTSSTAHPLKSWWLISFSKKKICNYISSGVNWNIVHKGEVMPEG